MEKQLHEMCRMKKPFFLLMLMMIALPLVGASCTGGNASGSWPSGSNGSGLGSTPTFSTTDFSLLKMFGTNNGWAITPESVLKTTDGGKTWTDLTPTDWEPADSQGTATATATNIEGIIGAYFLDVNRAWIVATTSVSQSDTNAIATAAATAISNIDATPTVNASKLPPVHDTVYVRSTIDGGHTWMTSNALTVQNLVGVSQPDFINEHEGWLELIEMDNSNGQHPRYIGDVYHTVDGGVTWKPDTTLGAGSGSIVSADQLDGLTIVPACVNTLNDTNNVLVPQCPVSPDSAVQGCTVTGTIRYLGLATAEQSSSLVLPLFHLANGFWRNDNSFPIPGKTSRQASEPLAIASPPLMFSDGNGVLPVQTQGKSNDSDSGSFPLRLYKVTLTSAEGDYTLSSLSPTTTFSVLPVSALHTLSAPDMQHVFVFGQNPSRQDGTPGNWNLYEFNGSNWITLTSQVDATIPTPAAAGEQPDFFDDALANLDFISPTEGWATNGSNVYHITIANNVATWSQVYPATSKTGSNSSSLPQQITIPRTPGQVIPSPANPAPCNSNTNNNNGSGNNSQTNPGNLPLSVFNTLPTDMHTWYNAASNDPPGYDSYPHAKGTGTYANPITFAIAENSRTFKQGEVIYIPELEKYFFAEDTCAACQDDLNQGRQDHIDLWTGDISNQCAINIKVPPTIYSQNPDPEPIHYLVVSSSDTVDQNYTVNTQPFSCG